MFDLKKKPNFNEKLSCHNIGEPKKESAFLYMKKTKN